jgi:hypothetical protein
MVRRPNTLDRAVSIAVVQEFCDSSRNSAHILHRAQGIREFVTDV